MECVLGEGNSDLQNCPILQGTLGFPGNAEGLMGGWKPNITVRQEKDYPRQIYMTMNSVPQQSSEMETLLRSMMSL